MGFEHPQADRLADRLPGYRPTIDYPLASGELVPNAEIAEALLVMSAGA
ncbi:hypothetical protein [Conexibacter sp. DBS9H8]|nr:hypothetical protein [Conexibacter sp. DBS9H8]